MLLETRKLSPLTDHTSGTFLVSKHKSTLAPVTPLVLILAHFLGAKTKLEQKQNHNQNLLHNFGSCC